MLSAARARGIAVAFAGRGEPPWFMTMSPDGTRVAVVSRDETVLVHDLVRRTTTTFAAERDGAAVAWLGDRLALQGTDSIIVVDVATGARTTIPSPAPITYLTGDAPGTVLAWIAGGRGFVSDGGNPIELPRRASAITHLRAGPGGHRMVIGDDQVRIVVRDGAGWRELLAIPDARSTTLSDDGSRFAVNNRGQLREWSLDDTTATAITTRTIGAFADAFYAGNRLLVQDLATHELVDHSGSPPQALLGGLARVPLPLADFADGEVAIADEDALLLARLGMVIRLRMPEIGHLLCARPGSPYVAVATSTHVLVWDLREVWPEPATDFAVIDLQPVGPRTVFANGLGVLRMFDTDGTSRDLAALGPAKYRIDVESDRLIQVDATGIDVLDVASDDRVRIPIADVVSATPYGPDSVLVLTADHVVTEQPLHGGVARELARIEPQVDWLLARAPWIAALGARHVWRSDGTTTVVAAIEPPTAGRFDADGTLYIASGDQVLRWRPGDASPTPLATIGAMPSRLEPIHDRTLPVIAADRGLYLIDLDDGVVRQALPASEHRAAVSGDGTTAVGLGDDHVVAVADLVTGQRFTLPTVGAEITRAVPAPDGRWVYAMAAFNRVLRFRTDQPRDPATLRAWILARTNARAADAGLVEWQLPTPAPVR